MVECVWADQESLPADDRGLAYGDGLFETIRVNGDQPTLMALHLQRAVSDARRLGIPVTQEELSDCLAAAVSRYATPDSRVLKMIVTRGSGGRGYKPAARPESRVIISCHDLPPIPSGPVEVSVCEHPLVIDPQFAGMKSLNRLPQVLASRSMPDRAYEALMTDQHGRYLEGTRTNLLARLGDDWITPPAPSLAVAGVAREAALDRLSSNGDRIVYRPIAPADLRHERFGGLLLLNSVMGAAFVGQVGDCHLPIHDSLAKIRSFLLDAVGS